MPAPAYVPPHKRKSNNIGKAKPKDPNATESSQRGGASAESLSTPAFLKVERCMECSRPLGSANCFCKTGRKRTRSESLERRQRRRSRSPENQQKRQRRSRSRSTEDRTRSRSRYHDRGRSNSAGRGDLERGREGRDRDKRRRSGGQAWSSLRHRHLGLSSASPTAPSGRLQ
jgi:hypothetical protein